MITASIVFGAPAASQGKRDTITRSPCPAVTNQVREGEEILGLYISVTRSSVPHRAEIRNALVSDP